jgi:hypothetical protein
MDVPDAFGFIRLLWQCFSLQHAKNMEFPDECWINIMNRWRMEANSKMEPCVSACWNVYTAVSQAATTMHHSMLVEGLAVQSANSLDSPGMEGKFMI